MSHSQFRQKCLEELAACLLIGGTVAGTTAAMLAFDSLLEAVTYCAVMVVLCTFACWEAVDFVDGIRAKRKRRLSA